MKYFLVTAKCGHVGKGKYLEVEFPIYAETKKEAAQKCLKRGKVKKQLKNAISSVREISYEEYIEKKLVFKNDHYIKAHTKIETVEYYEKVKLLETGKAWKKSFVDRREKIAFLMKKNKIKESCLYA